MNWTQQRYWDDVPEVAEIASIAFPLTVYRLVVAAGGNRDFNSIHNNSEFARAFGAPDMVANAGFLLATWERAVREFIGLDGTIRRISGFRLRNFNVVGDTTTVKGRVKRKWRDGVDGFVDIEVWSESNAGITIGPGTVTVTLPIRGSR